MDNKPNVKDEDGLLKNKELEEVAGGYPIGNTGYQTVGESGTENKPIDVEHYSTWEIIPTQIGIK